MNIAAIDLNLLVAFEVLLTKPHVTRYDKLARSYMAFLHLVCAFVRLA